MGIMIVGKILVLPVNVIKFCGIEPCHFWSTLKRELVNCHNLDSCRAETRSYFVNCLFCAYDRWNDIPPSSDPRGSAHAIFGKLWRESLSTPQTSFSYNPEACLLTSWTERQQHTRGYALVPRVQMSCHRNCYFFMFDEFGIFLMNAISLKTAVATLIFSNGEYSNCTESGIQLRPRI